MEAHALSTLNVYKVIEEVLYTFPLSLAHYEQINARRNHSFWTGFEPDRKE
jgi:hypothetical protein